MRDGLDEHPGGDEPFAADPVGQRAGDELPGAPDGGVQRGEDADLADGQPVPGEQQREQPQARPSLRLLTMPAWQAEDSAGSRKLVSHATWRVVRCPPR